MRGNKGLATNTLIELIRRAALRPSFQKKISTTRRLFEIQKDGFDTKESAQRWYDGKFANSWSTHKDFIDRIDKLLLTEKNLDFRAFNALQQYIITSGKSSFLLSDIDLDSCEIEEVTSAGKTDREIENRWKSSDKTFVRLYIPDDVGLATVKKYIDGRWPFIRDILLRRKKGQRSVRRTRNGERDRLICYYYGLSRAELGLKKSEPKDIAVACRLREEYGYSKVTPEIVRTIAHRKGLLRDN